MVPHEESRGLLFGMPLSLIWGYIAIALFMTGDGIELAFLSRYVVDLGFSATQASFLFLASMDYWQPCPAGAVECWRRFFGARRIMLIGVVGWIAFHILFLFFGLSEQNYPLMVLFYGIRAIAYPLFIYAFVVWVAQVAPRERLASAMGWYWTMYSIGIGFLGTYLPSFTIPHIGFMGTLWMAIIWVAMAGALVLFLIKKSTDGRY
ncbi:MFS transporter [Azotobacter vinelandii]